VIMSLFFVILFLGGYLLPIDIIYWYLKINMKYYLNFDLFQFGEEYIEIIAYKYCEYVLTDPLTNAILYPLVIGIKTTILIHAIIWIRASFPRIRYDQLMSFCWIIMLPILFGYIIILPCLIHVLL
jgi:NADH-ubiquinone oxidoreductase chain 1